MNTVHLNQSRSTSNLTCGICQRRYSNAIYMKYHTGESPYECDSCEKSFARSVTLREHLIWHTTKNVFSCNRCDRVFTGKQALSLHDRHCRQEGGLARSLSEVYAPDRRVHCEVCGSTFVSHRYLQIHMCTHTGLMPYSCEFCGKLFARADTYQIHVRSHTGEKPYVCAICGKALSSLGVERIHMRVHDIAKEPVGVDDKNSFINENDNMNSTSPLNIQSVEDGKC